MFGFKRNKKAQADNQIPYEVYETLRQPVERRRMFIIRLVAALAVATLLIFGALALSRKILHVGEENKQTGNSQSSQNQSEGNNSPSPAPQTPPAETETPTPATPSSPDTNTTTVRKPE